MDDLAERLGRIIERIRLQQTAAATEKVYQAIFDQSIEGVFLHDLCGGILDVNQAACRQTGYTKQELLQMIVFDLHPEASRTNMPQNQITRAWENLKPSERIYVEAEHQSKNGSIAPVQISTGLVRHLDKVMMLAIVQDISERRRAQEEVEEKERYLSTILSTTVEGFWVLDKNGISRSAKRLRMRSESARRNTGLSMTMHRCLINHWMIPGVFWM